MTENKQCVGDDTRHTSYQAFHRSFFEMRHPLMVEFWNHTFPLCIPLVVGSMINVQMGSQVYVRSKNRCVLLLFRASVARGNRAAGPGERRCLPKSGPAGFHMTSFSDMFKLGKEVLKTDTFVLHEAQTRGQGQQGAFARDWLSTHDITFPSQIAAQALATASCA